jgi:hypothetical protein
MEVTVGIPRKLYEKAREKGVDVESLVLESLVRELGLDPGEEAGIHVEIAEREFKSSKELISQGDIVQASEKLYKVAEECIKALSLAMGLNEANEAKAKGRWTLKLLDSAARKLSERISEDILHAWDSAYYLHVEGFHEARLDIESIKARVKLIEKLLEIARQVTLEKNNSTSSSMHR